MSEVLQTAVDPSAPVGEMRGHGVSVGGNHTFNRRFEEHGYIIGLISILPKASYQQGIHRLWSRDDRFDYFWPMIQSRPKITMHRTRDMFPSHDPTWRAGSI